MGMTEQGLLERAQERNDFYKAVATTAGAYSAGQVVGGLITIDNANGLKGPIQEQQLSVKLQDLAFIDSASQSAQLDLFFFNKQPATSMSDKATFAPSVADLQACVGTASVATSDYIAGGASGTIAAGKNQSNLQKILKPAVSGATAMYCVIVSRGTPTYGANALAVRFQFDA